MKRLHILSLLLVLALCLPGCNRGGSCKTGGGTDGGGTTGGNGGTLTEQSLLVQYRDEEPPQIRGALDAFTRIRGALNGDPADGVRITSTGTNAIEAEVDIDLDGNGSRETTMLFPAQFSNDPLDGLQDADFPITSDIVNQVTPVGIFSSTVTVTSLGGSASPTIFLVQGTSTLVSGNRTQITSYGYTADITFPNIPLFGSKSTTITKGGDTATYDVTYDYNTQGGQYLKVEGDINGSSFVFELGGQRQAP